LIRKRPLLSSRKRRKREKAKAGPRRSQLKGSRLKRDRLKRSQLIKRKERARNPKKLKKKARRNDIVFLILPNFILNLFSAIY
jgi:hypothetical protein